jgi:uncharacterized membrane protein YecN with MAPEG domain
MELQVPITGLYAALQAFLAIALAIPIGPLRLKHNVSVLDGGHADLTIAIRRHANWTEHVPFALLLIGLLELNGGGASTLHGLGIALLVARIAHPLGLNAQSPRNPLRGIGAGGTLLVTAIAAVLLLLKFF